MLCSLCAPARPRPTIPAATIAHLLSPGPRRSRRPLRIRPAGIRTTRAATIPHRTRRMFRSRRHLHASTTTRPHAAGARQL